MTNTNPTSVGWYLVKTARTDKWPYACLQIVAGPCISETALRSRWVSRVDAKLLKIRYWDGKRWLLNP